MKLLAWEPDDISDDRLVNELAVAVLAMESGVTAVLTGDYESVTSARVTRQMSVLREQQGGNSLFHDFCAWRDYGFLGKYRDGIPHPHDGYALALMSAPAVELFGGQHAYTCSAVLQAMLAREKIDVALGRPNPGFYSDGWFLEFSNGGSTPGLTAYELALLSRISVQSVRNEFQKPGAPRTQKNTAGLVTVDAVDAQAWLLGRRGFIDSYSVETTDDRLLVPVAKDGSAFDVSCRQSAGYKIGRKGEERYIETFTEALDELSKMPKAYWRRPSATSGVPGVVGAATWLRKSRKELGLE